MSIPEFEASASDPAVVSAPTLPPAAGPIEVSPGDRVSSLPSGENDPSVTLDYAPGENCSDGGVESRNAGRQVGDNLYLAEREKAERTDECSSMDHHQVSAKVQIGPQSLKSTSVGVAPGPSETNDIHEIFAGATKLIEDNYRDWALTQEDDDLYEQLKAADQANTRDLPHQDERALLEAIELMPRFLRRA